jgi:serine/threonine protein kinase
LIQNLRESQLLSEELLEQVRARVQAGEPSGNVASALIDEGVLTPYQVRQLEAGQGKGLVLGQYRILDELGRGGFGWVYKAAHVLMDRIVALKVIAPERVEDERARAMFLREVRAATRLHHPNIALAYDAGEAGGRLFMAIEYVAGPTLDQLVRKQGPLPVNLAWPMLLQAAQALRYAHEQGMVHRDIKPANLLVPDAALSDSGRLQLDAPALIKVVDFGLARLQSQGASATLFAGKDKVFAGTPDYVSPEQARSVHDVDIRADLYSLGCTFYFALTGGKPFHGATALEIVLQHIEKEPEPLGLLRPDLPPTLTSCIRRLMEKRRERRFQSPAELLAEMGVLSIGGSQPVISLPSWPSLVLPPAPPGAPAFRKSGMMARPVLGAEDNMSATLQIPAVGGPSPAVSASNPPGVLGAVPAESADDAGHATVIALDTQEEPNAVACAAAPPTVAQPRRAMQQAWRKWHALVAALVQRTGPLAMEAADYKALHSLLLAEIRAHTAAEPLQYVACRRLELLIEPWLSLAVLTRTDPETLQDVMIRSEEVADELGLSAAKSGLPRWLIWLLLLLLSLAVGGIALSQLSGGRPSWHFPSLQSVWHFVEANPILSMTLLLPATVLGALFGLSRLVKPE